MTFAALQARMKDAGGNTVITLSDGRITLTGIAAATLDESSFTGLVSTATTHLVGTDGDDVTDGTGAALTLEGGLGNDTYVVPR